MVVKPDYALTFFTDGACSGNPGPGAWGFLAHKGSQICAERTGFCPQTTNNRMELSAVIEALSWCHAQEGGTQSTCVVSDSQYVVRGITQWVHTWQRQGWVTSQKKPVENQDLWKQLLDISAAIPQLSWNWVRGHSGHPGNEAVDALVQRCLRQGMGTR